MNNNFSSNIKLLRTRRRLTQEDLAGIMQMKRSTLSGYETKVAQPTIPILIAFSDYFKVSIDSLLRIDLKQLNEKELYELEHGNDVYLKGSNLRVLATTVNSQNRENIELVDEKAKAGYTRGFADITYIENLPVYNLPFLSNDRKYRTFQISGDSMLPIPDGSWITTSFVQNWLEIEKPTACIVVMLNQGVVFKMVENKIQTDGSIVLHSLNKAYAPYPIEIGEVKEIWQFVHFISSEIPEVFDNNRLADKLLNLENEIVSIRKNISTIGSSTN